MAVLAGCGGEDASVRGSFAAGFAPGDRVVALGTDRVAEVRDGGFELKGLPRAPAALRVMRGSDTVGWLDLPDTLVSDLALNGLRLDPASHRLFPESVAGANLVEVNGVRFAARGLPDSSVDASGHVLAASPDGAALLFRTDNAGPDLRVVVDSATEAVTADGSPLFGWRSRPGDTMRVAGPVRAGIVHASRLTLPSETQVEAQATAEPAPAEAAATSTVPAVRSATAPAAVRAPAPRARSSPPGNGRGHGRGRGKGKKG